MYLIYKVTNTLNGKIYIGLTGSCLSRRQSGHKCDALNRKYNLPFHNAIRKYGWENFKWEIIKNNISNREEAKQAERECIKLHDSQNHVVGYNVTSGGDGLDPTDIKTIKKITDSVNKYYQSETFDRIKHGQDRGTVPFYVFKISGEYVEKFLSQVECSEKLKISRSDICECLQGKAKTAKGYVFCLENKFPDKLSYAKNVSVKVMLHGQYIKTYPSLRQACKDLNVGATVVKNYFKKGYSNSTEYTFEKVI